MKKIFSLAAMMLLMAGMMVSCKKEKEPEVKNEYVKEIMSIHDMVFDKMLKEAETALMEAGFKPADVEKAPAKMKGMKKMPAEMEVENLEFLKTIDANHAEMVILSVNLASGKVMAYLVDWSSNADINDAVLCENAAEFYKYGKKNIDELGLFFADVMADEAEFVYLEDPTDVMGLKKEFEDVKKDLDQMLADREITQAEYDRYMKELEGEFGYYGTPADFLKDLEKGYSYKDEMEIAIQIQDMNIIKSQNGVFVVAGAYADKKNKESEFFFAYQKGHTEAGL